MDEDKLLKRVLECRFEGRRPRMRWYDNAVKYLQSLGLQNPGEEGFEMAAYRRVWRDLVRSAWVCIRPDSL